jgi:hypothetical protein
VLTIDFLKAPIKLMMQVRTIRRPRPQCYSQVLARYGPYQRF